MLEDAVLAAARDAVAASANDDSLAAKRMWLEGVIQARDGNLKGGISLLEQVICANEFPIGALSTLGILLGLDGRLEESVAVFQQVLVALPDDPAVQANLARSLSRLGRRRESVEHYERAVSSSRVPWHVRNNLAVQLLRLGEFHRAEQLLLEAIRQKPIDRLAFHNLVQHRLADGRLEDAKAIVSAAAAELDGTWDLLEARARVAFAEGDFAAVVSALGALDTTLDVHVEAERLRLASFHQLLRFDEALDAYRRAIARGVDDGIVDWLGGQAAGNSGQHAAALKSFQSAVRKLPDQPELAVQLGMALVRVGRCEEASAILSAVVAVAQRDALAFDALAESQHCLGLTGDALASIARAVALDPSDPITRSHYSIILLATGDVAGAVREAETAHQLAPSEPLFRENLASLKSKSAK